MGICNFTHNATVYTLQACRDMYRTGVHGCIQYRRGGMYIGLVQGVYSTGVQGCLQDWSAWVYTVQACRDVYSTGVQGCIQYRHAGMCTVLECRVYTVLGSTVLRGSTCNTALP